MTEQAEQAVKQATPAPVPQKPEDAYSAAQRLRAQAASIEATLPEDKYVRLKVSPPHSGLSFGAVNLTSDWTAVPRSLAPASCGPLRMPA